MSGAILDVRFENQFISNRYLITCQTRLDDRGKVHEAGDYIDARSSPAACAVILASATAAPNSRSPEIARTTITTTSNCFLLFISYLGVVVPRTALG